MIAGCRDLARRDSARHGRVGRGRVLFVLAEGPRRAVRAVADCVSRRARSRGASRAGASISIFHCSPRTGSTGNITTRFPRRSCTRCTRRWEKSRRKGSIARWARHESAHQRLVSGLLALGISLLPDAADRLWSLNAVQVPAGVSEAGVAIGVADPASDRNRRRARPARRPHLARGPDGIRRDAGNVDRLLAALPDAIRTARGPRHSAWARRRRAARRGRVRRIGRWAIGAMAIGFACVVYTWLTLPDVRPLRTQTPATTAFMRMRSAEAAAAGKKAAISQHFVRVRPHQPAAGARGPRRRGRGVLRARGRRLRRAEGVDRGESGSVGNSSAARRRSPSSWPRTCTCRRRAIRTAR